MKIWEVIGGGIMTAIGLGTLILPVPVFCWGLLVVGIITLIHGLVTSDAPSAPAVVMAPQPYAYAGYQAPYTGYVAPAAPPAYGYAPAQPAYYAPAQPAYGTPAYGTPAYGAPAYGAPAPQPYQGYGASPAPAASSYSGYDSAPSTESAGSSDPPGFAPPCKFCGHIPLTWNPGARKWYCDGCQRYN